MMSESVTDRDVPSVFSLQSINLFSYQYGPHGYRQYGGPYHQPL